MAFAPYLIVPARIAGDPRREPVINGGTGNAALFCLRGAARLIEGIGQTAIYASIRSGCKPLRSDLE
jgi:hypothetical protein